MDCALRTERGQLPKLPLLILATPRWWWENSSRISASEMACVSLGFLAVPFRRMVFSFSMGETVGVSGSVVIVIVWGESEPLVVGGWWLAVGDNIAGERK